MPADGAAPSTTQAQPSTTAADTGGGTAVLDAPSTPGAQSPPAAGKPAKAAGTAASSEHTPPPAPDFPATRAAAARFLNRPQTVSGEPAAAPPSRGKDGKFAPASGAAPAPARPKAAPAAPAATQDDAAEPQDAAGGEDQAQSETEPAQEQGTDALGSFAKRFGIPVDKAQAAAKSLIDDFDSTLDDESEQPAEPQARAQQPQRRPSAPPAPPAARAAAAPSQRQQAAADAADADQITDADIEHLATAYEDPVLAKLAKGLRDTRAAIAEQEQAQRTSERAQVQAQAQHAVQVVLPKIHAALATEGYAPVFGEPGKQTRAQYTAWCSMLDDAIDYQARKGARGQFVSDEDAVRASTAAFCRDQLVATAKDAGRQEALRQIQKRSEAVDVIPGAGSSGGSGHLSGGDLPNTRGAVRTFLRNRRAS